jgi:hypothetical protein
LTDSLARSTLRFEALSARSAAFVFVVAFWAARWFGVHLVLSGSLLALSVESLVRRCLRRVGGFFLRPHPSGRIGNDRGVGQGSASGDRATQAATTPRKSCRKLKLL